MSNAVSDAGAPAVSPASGPVPASTAAAPRKRRRLKRLSTRDKIILTLMIGVPTLVELVFIWGPAISTVFLSFTNAQGAAPIQNVGTHNYHVLRTIDP